MLEVLARSPVTTPLEACLSKETEAEVFVINLIGEVPRAVAIWLASGGLDDPRTVIKVPIVGIVKRIDINGQSTGMLRQFGRAGDDAEAEARRVVVAHLRLVVGIIDIRQHHPLNRVLCIEELAQDVHHALGNHLVAHHLAHVHLIVVVPVQGADVAQVVTAYVGILLEGLTLHPLPDAVGDGLSGEALVDASVSGNGLGCDSLSSLPQVECRCARCVVVFVGACQEQKSAAN